MTITGNECIQFGKPDFLNGSCVHCAMDNPDHYDVCMEKAREECETFADRQRKDLP